MSDQPIPTAADDSDPEKARRNSEIREAVLDEVTLANDVAIAGRKPEYLSRLLEDALEEPQLVDLEEAVKTVRGLITTVGGKRSDTRHSTREQNKLRDALLIQLGVRALAKKVYERGNPRRADYYIGKQVDKSRAFLCQVSESMITHAKTDPVLKISPRLLTAFQGGVRRLYGRAQQPDRQANRGLRGDTGPVRGGQGTGRPAARRAIRGRRHLAGARKASRPDSPGVQAPDQSRPGVNRRGPDRAMPHPARGEGMSGRISPPRPSPRRVFCLVAARALAAPWVQASRLPCLSTRPPTRRPPPMQAPGRTRFVKKLRLQFKMN